MGLSRFGQIAALAAALGFGMAAGPAHGQSVAGAAADAAAEVSYSVQFTVTGTGVDADAIRAASQLYAGRDAPAPSGAALLARARADYARILAALYAQGRYAGVITILVAGADPAATGVDALPAGTIPVIVLVDPGPAFVFGAIDISNPPPVNAGPGVAAEAGLLAGAVARSGIVFRTENLIVDAWRQLGHPTAAIAGRSVLAQHASGTLDVALQVDPGPPAVFGPVAVSGNERTDTAFLLRQAGITPGTQFDPDALADAAASLGRLGVFQSIRIIEAETVAPDGTLPVTVSVIERPARVFGIGASISTVEGAAIGAYWQHRNLFGRAEQLRVEGRIGGIGEQGFTGIQSFDYAASISFLKPGIFTSATDLYAEFSGVWERLDVYTNAAVVARAGLTHVFSDTLSGEAGLRVELSQVEDALGVRGFLMASLPVAATLDMRDDVLSPSTGFRISVSAEPFYEFFEGNAGIILDAQASAYVPFGDRFVLAARIAAGSILGAPAEELPANRLFFAGGGGSIRGYGYRNVGPTLPGGEVVGGLSYLEGSLELRVQITDTIGVVPFVDVGAAFASPFPDFSEPLRFSVGLGLRYDTVLGPLRLDVALPLNRGPGDPSFGIYIGIGHSF